MGPRGGTPAEHARQFRRPVPALDRGDLGHGPAVAGNLGDDQVRLARRRHRRQVGDAEHLPPTPDLPHLVAHGMGRLATDVGVDLVEHQDRDVVLRGQHGLEREHHAGEFARGRDRPQSPRRFARIRRELEFGGVEPAPHRFLERLQVHREFALLETQVPQLGGRRPDQLRHRPTSRRSELAAGLPEFAFDTFEFGCEPGAALGRVLQAACPLASLGPERDHVRHRPAVLPSERVQQVDPLLEFAESGGVEIDPVGIGGQPALQLPQVLHHLPVQLRPGAGGRIQPPQFVQGPTDPAGDGQEGVVAFGEASEGFLDQLEQSCGIPRPVMFRLDRFLLARLQPRRLDLGHLMPQQVQFPGPRPFVGVERRQVCLQAAPAVERRRESSTGGFEPGEGVEEVELAGGLEKGLVVVRPVDVDQPVAEGREGLERRGRAVDELPVAARRGQGALQHELPVLDRLESGFLEPRRDRGAHAADIEHALDRAGIGAGPDQSAIGALAEEEVEGPDEDRFPRARLAGDRVEPRTKLDRQVGDEREVLDAQMGQHAAGRPAIWRGTPPPASAGHPEVAGVPARGRPARFGCRADLGRDEGRRGWGAIGDARGTGDVGGRGRAKRPGRPRAAWSLSTHNCGMHGGKCRAWIRAGQPFPARVNSAHPGYSNAFAFDHVPSRPAASTPMTDTTPPPAAQAGDEFEREPVPESARKGGAAFWGMYAGEHTAGTEFMIGPLFVSWGASAFDLIFGLLLGNLMAVLCWRFLTAEIAARKRLTLYYQLEKITGRGLVTLYNLFNGVLFCFLAGAMVTVSATAVGVPFGDSIRMPTFADTLPTGVAWVAACLVIGAAMTFVAVRGYGFVARMGHLAAPWMFLVFLACGIVMLAKLGTTNLFELIQPPAGTTPKIGFWGIVFFSWFCNAAMHLGMSDLSVLRFARRPSSGWAAAAGMYLGHYVAWICAALLLVYWVKMKGADPAQGVAPGPMVDDAVGLAGLICVVIAGWTTANPTIYRAGLAFQGMFPRMSRTTGTILAGAVCTVASIFPAFAMKLLDFVGIYGTILAPVGAVIVVDHYLAGRCGLVSEPAARHGLRFNLSVLLAWVIPVGLGLWGYRQYEFPAFFLPLPCWFACGALYIAFSRLLGPKASPRPA
jgi:NCS1 family nucleobase:cation symporter-1